jgi:SPFH domain / Band 7 family.
MSGDYNCDSYCEDLGNCKQKAWCLTFLSAITIILISILIPCSIKYVDYDKYALRVRIDKQIDYSYVYDQGVHVMSPGSTLAEFSSTYIRIDYLKSKNSHLRVFAESGLEFDIDIIFYFKLTPQNLPYVYKAYGYGYLSNIDSQAKAALKDVASMYSSDQFVKNRTDIESHMASKLNEILEEKAYIKIEEPLVILLSIEFPESLDIKYLETTLEIQNNIQQEDQQKVALIVANTNTMLANITAQTEYLLKQSEYEASKTVESSKAAAEKIKMDAEGRGIKYATDKLNMTEDMVGKFIAVNSISSMKGVRLTYGLTNTLITP